MRPLSHRPPSPGAGRGGAARDTHDHLEERLRAAEEEEDPELVAKLEQQLDATHYANVTLPGKATGGETSKLKPQNTEATLTVKCNTCLEQWPLPAQTLSSRLTQIQVTVKASLHSPACKYSSTNLQVQVARRAVPADGGWKTCCSGKLNIAWASPPAPQK